MPSGEMNVIRRIRGRPRQRRDHVGGRDLVVSATRELLRRNPTQAAQRREVAIAAGVTPALLCYYFPDHSDLLETATKPVLLNYLESLLAIIAGADDAQIKLRSVIRLLIRVNRQEPNFVETYIDLVKRKADGGEQVLQITAGYNALVDFVSAIFPAKPEPGVLVFALWGMCRMVAHQPILPIKIVQSESGEANETLLVEHVLQMVNKGSPVQPDGRTLPLSN